MMKKPLLSLLFLCTVLLAGCPEGGPGRPAATVPTAGAQQPYPGGMVIEPDDANLRYIGHWDKWRLSEQAVTVNSGSRVLCIFTGGSLRGRFAIQGITHPAQIYVSLDRRKPQLYTLNAQLIDFVPKRLGGGRHTLQIAVKDVDERANRWQPPLASAVIFQGLVIDPGAKTLPLPPPSARQMEFYGDSITQGVRALSMAIGTAGSDGTKDYAFLTALAFGARSNQVGFGRQGIIRTGNGGVPPAAQSFGWNFVGSKADPSFVPQVVVVNQGTNDGMYPSAQFEPAYLDYIREIRAADPKSWIFCMRPFGGFHEKDVRAAVQSLSDPHTVYVDTAGWLDRADYTDGVHPTAAGHVKAARKLVRAISTSTGWKTVRSVDSDWWKVFP